MRLVLEQVDLLKIERCSLRAEATTRNVINAVALMFLFGGFCGVWAQNTGRSSVFWFLAGFLTTIVAVCVILRLNVTPARKKRGRHTRGHRIVSTEADV